MQSLLENLDALLITDPTNIRYLTGFVGVSPTEREAYVLITKNTTFLFTNVLYVEKARKLVGSKQYVVGSRPLEIVEILREEPITKKIKIVFESLFPERSRRNTTIKLGFEENDLTYKEFQTLKEKFKDTPRLRSENKSPTTEVTPTSGRVEEFRKIKRGDEIEYIRDAAKLTDACFDFILKKLKPGISELAVAWDIETFFRKNGAGSAFSPIVAFGENSSQPHYSSSINYELQTTHLVLLDFGARVQGYCADMTRVVFLEKPTSEQKRVYETVLKAQQAVLTALTSSFDYSNNRTRNSHISIYENGRRKISGAQLDKLARSIIEKAGLIPYPHSLGHAVGLDIHEAPRLSFKKDEILKPGMIITIEPGVYLEGKFGMRIEDLVLIKENGIEVLSQSSKRLMTL